MALTSILKPKVELIQALIPIGWGLLLTSWSRKSNSWRG